jgi:hypothetical protein
MSSPRPPLRLVGPPERDTAGDHAGVDLNKDVGILRAVAGSTPAGVAPVARVDPATPLRSAQDDGDVHELTIVDDAEPAEEEPPRTPLSPRFVVVALVVFQLLAASSYLGKYTALAQGDDQFKFAAAMTVPASLCLYVGAILLALRPGRGRLLFLAAAAGFGLSLPAWGVGYGWSWPMAFGAILALAGAWYARAEPRPDPSSAAQP